MASIKERGGFLREFLKHPLKTGAIAPSSTSLVRTMLHLAHLDEASHIAELGTGTGVFTKMIGQHKRPQASFIALEINPKFVKQTQEKCPETEIRQDSAANLARYLDRTGGEGFDAIISGLPWADFKDALQDQLLDAIDRSLADGGRFVTFAYLQGLLFPAGRRFRRKLKARFPRVSQSSIIWSNLPPAFVYIVEKGAK